eukprot:12333014-Prorocentrum_lima.AAC.1
MTSSLVGSEMCIRDSSESHDGAEALYRGQLSLLRTTGSNTSVNTWASTCLLYTSDAADDM